MGKRAPRTLREKIHLVKRNSCFEEKNLIKSIWWKIVHNSQIKKAPQNFRRAFTDLMEGYTKLYSSVMSSSLSLNM